VSPRAPTDERPFASPAPAVQGTLERAQRPMLQCLHCTHRLPHDLGRLRGRQVLEEPEDQDLLLLVGQSPQGLVQVFIGKLLDGKLGRIRRHRQRRGLQRNEGRLALAAVMVDGRVVRDPVDPGGEGNALVLEEIQTGEAAGHGIDGQVLRILCPSEAGVGIVVDTVEVAFEEDPRRVLVASANPLDERAIVVGRRLSEGLHRVTLWALSTRTGMRLPRTGTYMFSF